MVPFPFWCAPSCFANVNFVHHRARARCSERHLPSPGLDGMELFFAAPSTMLHDDALNPPPRKEGVVHSHVCLRTGARRDVADLLWLHDVCGSDMAQHPCIRLWVASYTGTEHLARDKQKAGQKGHLSLRGPGGQPSDGLSGAP